MRLNSAVCFILVLIWGDHPAHAEPIWLQQVTPFLKDHCVGCHTGGAAKGGLNLDRPETNLNDAEVLSRWVRVHDRVTRGEMPPRAEAKPEPDAIKKFQSQLSTALIRADVSRRQTLLRRLNRIEYENTVRDLFGIRVDLQEMLPADPSANGFDTVGEVLAISPEQLEISLRAADKALDQVFGASKAPERVAVKLAMGLDEFAGRSIGQLFLKTEDDSLITFQPHWCPSVFRSGEAKVDGTYRVKIKAKTYQTDKPVIMAVYGGDVIVGRSPSHLVGYYDVAPGKDAVIGSAPRPLLNLAGALAADRYGAGVVTGREEPTVTPPWPHRRELRTLQAISAHWNASGRRGH